MKVYYHRHSTYSRAIGFSWKHAVLEITAALNPIGLGVRVYWDGSSISVSFHFVLISLEILLD